MWPFEKRANRYPTADAEPASGATTSATDVVVDGLLARATGTAVDAGSLGLAEACVGLWSRALSSATVEPMNNRTEGLTPALLALAGRSLATRGNLVLAIQIAGTTVRLAPAADFDVSGGADPEGWTYRLNLAGPSATETVLLPSAGVIHLRIGASVDAPWRGISPLNRASGTAALGAAVESSLLKEAKLPTGRLAVAYGAQKVDGVLSWLRQGGFAVAGDSSNRGVSPEPAQRHRPQTYGPEPQQVMESLRSDTGRDIANAFGVSPALFAERGDGAGQREAWRRFWLGTVQPLAVQIQAEVREKLHPDVSIGLEALKAADVDANSRAVARRATAYKTFRDSGIEDGEARRLAGL